MIFAVRCPNNSSVSLLHLTVIDTQVMVSLVPQEFDPTFVAQTTLSGLTYIYKRSGHLMTH